MFLARFLRGHGLGRSLWIQVAQRIVGKVTTGRMTHQLDAFHRSWLGQWTLRVIAATASLRIPLVTWIALSGFRRWLILTARVHLVAGEHVRAFATMRVVNALFRPHIRARHLPTALAYFQTLSSLRLYQRIALEAPCYEHLDNRDLVLIIGQAHVFRLHADVAIAFLSRATELAPRDHESVFGLGDAWLIKGEYSRAAALFHVATRLAPVTVMAHQNLAGRYDVRSYQPVAWELHEAGKLKIYDRLGRIAEQILLSGDVENSLLMYNRLLVFQALLARDFDLLENLRQRLALECANFDPTLPVRILPYEWTTQFGHMGLLDSYMKMVTFGWQPRANHVLLAPAGKVANPEYLAYWDHAFCVVRDRATVDALFPYQRHFGEGFIALRSPANMAEPWARAAARAHILWARQARPPLLRLTELDQASGQYQLAQLGIPEGAWYVALHARDSGYYGEGSTGGNAHRNAAIEDYVPAIREITDRGGYVVRLGDHTMKPLPKMDRVIDYACSPGKSPALDLFILATSRFVIGTTSGLTNVALSFGTPMLLVNCISNDWQAWTDQVDFILKKVYDRRRQRYLRLHELCSRRILGHLINFVVMEQMGYSIHANSAEEIRAATAYKLDVVLGQRLRAGTHDPYMQRYRQAVAHNPYVFGAARMVPDFIAANLFLVAHRVVHAGPEPWDGLTAVKAASPALA